MYDLVTPNAMVKSEQSGFDIQPNIPFSGSTSSREIALTNLNTTYGVHRGCHVTKGKK